MRFIAREMSKILLRFAVLLTPIGLFVSFLLLGRRGIPAWNIGIRNVIALALGNAAPIAIVSYLAATLLTVALIDKTKVRSIFLVHIPPILAAVIILGGLYLIQNKRQPFPLVRGALTLGRKVFIKENVFTNLKEYSLFLKEKGKDPLTLFIYDRAKNDLGVIPGLRFERGKPNALYLDDRSETVVIKRKGAEILSFPYREFGSKPAVTGNRLVRFYAKGAGAAAKILEAHGAKLRRRDRYLFSAALLLSVLMLSIPLTFAFNDAGWGFSGLTGAVLVLAALPYVYWGVFKAFQATGLRAYLTVGYGYLFPCAILCLLGVLIDLIIKIKARR
jgi:hypothetical protein